MKRCLILVEGQTEEIFVNAVLGPHLAEHGFTMVQPVVLKTRRAASGRDHRGGVSSWGRIERDLRPLLADSAALVTTLIDYYGMPADTPGATDRPAGDPGAAVVHVERAMFRVHPVRTFVPHLTLHEFETMLFTAPEIVAEHAGDPSLRYRLERIVATYGGQPERIDDGPTTAPAQRIMRLWPDYRKTSDGTALVTRIGLRRIRSACPHLDAWIAQLERWPS